jgi:spore photoproduct lyase
LGPNPQIIFAWSINPPALVKGEEHGAASLAARLQAARAAAEAGFRLALHFDPLIFLPGWQRAYQKTVEILEQSLPGRAVGWISMGGLRFLPPLRDLIRRRFPASRVPAAEMVRAPDGKLRYYKSLRLEMYGHLREWLTQAFPDVFIYLCMESPRLWQEVFGFAPTSEELGHLLDRRAQGKD